MKNSVRIAVLVVGIMTATGLKSSAQYEAGDKLLNLGIGLGSFTAGKSTLPPLSVSYEHGFTDKISAGGILGYSGSKFDGGFYKINYSYIIVGARGSYHFYLNNNIDAYGGVTIGYNIVNSKLDPDPGFPVATASSNLLYGFHLGGRYYFTEKLGAFAELGYGIAWITVGLAMKL